jgi:hypothetical protein
MLILLPRKTASVILLGLVFGIHVVATALAGVDDFVTSGSLVVRELGLPVVAFLTVLFNGTIEYSSSRWGSFYFLRRHDWRGVGASSCSISDQCGQ